MSARLSWIARHIRFREGQRIFQFQPRALSIAAIDTVHAKQIAKGGLSLPQLPIVLDSSEFTDQNQRFFQRNPCRCRLSQIVVYPGNPGQRICEVEVCTISGACRQCSPDRGRLLKVSERFPKLMFESTALEGSGNTWKLTGNLTIKDAKRPVVLDVEWSGIAKDPWGNTKAGLRISGRIDRKEWGLNWNAALEAGGVLVSDEVRIQCEVQLAQQG